MPRASKKLRNNGKQVQTAAVKPGSPMHVMNLPVEVFLEIGAYCRPLDLLRLSRVSSELRGVLLAKRHKRVWVSARNRLDPPMPECPEDLSEPRYASLVFDQFCTACGAAGKVLIGGDRAAAALGGAVELTISYAGRVRLCTQCWKTNVKEGYAIMNEFDLKVRRDRSLKRVLFDLVPEVKVARQRSLARVTLYIEPEVNDIIVIDHHAAGGVRQTSRQSFYQPEVVAMAKEYYTLVESSGGDAKTMDEFVERRKNQTLERLDFHFVVAQWDYDHYRAQADVKLEALRERKAAIEKRLEDLGYEPEDWLRTPEFEKAANHTDPLTEGAWDEMQPKLLSALAPRRAQREATEFRETYWQRTSQVKAYYLAFLAADRAPHPWKRMLPHFVEAVKLPCVRALVKSAPSPDTPLPAAHFAAIEARLREEAQPYCKRVRGDLARVFRRGRAAELGVRWDGPPSDFGVAVNPDDADDADADQEVALLDAHDALFRCTSFPCNNFSRTVMTVSGLLEHWQQGHPYEWNGGQRIWVAAREVRDQVPVLIEALGLPADTTLSALEDAIASQVGRPACVCDKPIEPVPNRYEALDRLLHHFLASRSAPEVLDGSQEAIPVKHVITFDRTTEAAEASHEQIQ